MDYEEKYKKALEWAKKVMQGKVGFVLDDVLEKFPELKESDDERIRKELICFLETEIPQCNARDKYITWLEKQGEHANFRNKIQIGDKVTRNKDGVLVNLSQLKRIAKPAENKGKHNMGISEATKQKLEDNLNKALEKEIPESCNEFLDEQGEQPKKHDVCDNCDQQGSCVSPCPMKLVEKQGEQKPVVEWSAYDKATLEYIIEDIKELRDNETEEGSIETYERELNLLRAINDSVKLSNYTNPAEWSEEDGRIWRGLFGLIKDCYLNGGYALATREYDDYKKWLKSLKDRVQLQPKQEWKQEWSEEDETYLDHIITAIKSYYTDDKGKENPWREELLRWLKSLRPQSHWKPSTLQIEALESATENCAYSEYQDCLRELAKQLKKL